MTFDDHPVHRTDLFGPDDQDIAGLDIVERNFFQFVVLQTLATRGMRLANAFKTDDALRTA